MVKTNCKARKATQQGQKYSHQFSLPLQGLTYTIAGCMSVPHHFANPHNIWVHWCSGRFSRSKE